jgi:hypothetical protein
MCSDPYKLQLVNSRCLTDIIGLEIVASFCSIPRVDSHCNASITDSLPIPSYLWCTLPYDALETVKRDKWTSKLASDNDVTRFDSFTPVTPPSPLSYPLALVCGPSSTLVLLYFRLVVVYQILIPPFSINHPSISFTFAFTFIPSIYYNTCLIVNLLRSLFHLPTTIHQSHQQCLKQRYVFFSLSISLSRHRVVMGGLEVDMDMSCLEGKVEHD